jgi:hypothetical protein
MEDDKCWIMNFTYEICMVTRYKNSTSSASGFKTTLSDPSEDWCAQRKRRMLLIFLKFYILRNHPPYALKQRLLFWSNCYLLIDSKISWNSRLWRFDTIVYAFISGKFCKISWNNINPKKDFEHFIDIFKRSSINMTFLAKHVKAVKFYFT